MFARTWWSAALVACVMGASAVAEVRGDAAADGPAKNEQPKKPNLAEALARPAPMEFVESPLNDVCAYIADVAKIEFQLDRAALAELDITGDTPVTFHSRELALRDALTLMLRNVSADLTWMQWRGVLLVTSKERASRSLATRMYDVRDLVDEGVEDNELYDIIQNLVEPTSWSDYGGQAKLLDYHRGQVRALVVAQTEDAHFQIEDLLKSLRKLDDSP